LRRYASILPIEVVPFLYGLKPPALVFHDQPCRRVGEQEPHLNGFARVVPVAMADGVLEKLTDLLLKDVDIPEMRRARCADQMARRRTWLKSRLNALWYIPRVSKRGSFRLPEFAGSLRPEVPGRPVPEG
jgi:hypothetical protein